MRDGETLDDWTELGTMIGYRGVRGQDVEEMMKMFFNNYKNECVKPKLTVLERDLRSSRPWIIFSIECDRHTDGTGPESQVWHVLQGRDALYTNQRALKVAKIPKKTKQELLEFFKGARLVYKE